MSRDVNGLVVACYGVADPTGYHTNHGWLERCLESSAVAGECDVVCRRERRRGSAGIAQARVPRSRAATITSVLRLALSRSSLWGRGARRVPWGVGPLSGPPRGGLGLARAEASIRLPAGDLDRALFGSFSKQFGDYCLETRLIRSCREVTGKGSHDDRGLLRCRREGNQGHG